MIMLDENEATQTYLPRHRTLYVVIAVAALLFVFAVVWLTLLRPKASAPSGDLPIPVAEEPSYPSVKKGIVKPVDIPAIPPGINRPLKQEEKMKYGFSEDDDIWVKTSSPIDGSQPAMAFYNKTVNPDPYPTVPVIIPHN